jgi:glycosyltransferase involved in cell wall biosynthesis
MFKILHIINKLDPGGAEVMLLDILKYADRKSFDYHILLPKGKGEFDHKAESMGLNLHYPPGSSNSKISIYRECVNIIRKIKPDLIHTHTRFSDLIGLYGGKIAGVPVRLMTVHAAGMYFFDSPNFLEGLVEYFVVKNATHFAVISNGVKGYLQRNIKVRDDMISVIYNGIDIERVCPAAVKPSGQTRSELGLRSDDFIVCYAGRLAHEKGVDLLIDEFALISQKIVNAKLLIVGKGILEDTLRDQISKTGLQDKVVIHRHFGGLSDYLKASNCFVLPSRNEGFGLVILEAMANGLPVIASKVGGIPEIIEHRVNGLLFDNAQKGELAACIKMLHDDPNLSEEFIKAGKVTACEKFDVRFTTRNYEELYRRLIAK